MRSTRREIMLAGAGSLLGTQLWGRVARAQKPGARITSVVLLYMEGGPAHMDTWDLKANSAFKPLSSAVDGIAVSEHLPLLGARMKDLALVRSVTSKEGNHDRARYLMHTGHVPQGGVDHPALGSLLAQRRGRAELPGYVSIGGPGKDAGFLGAAWAPFPVRNPLQGVKHLRPPGSLDEARFQRRMELWRAAQQRFVGQHPGAVAVGQDAVAEQAIRLMTSERAHVFELDREPLPTRQRYGDTPFQAGCLLARRLVEAGVPFVEVTLRGWDTHKDNFATVQRLSAELDRGMSALLDDLRGSGLLATTLVLWMGDFGRSPRVNADGGRDHHPRAFSVVLAGGGVRGGQVVGATDEEGDQVVSRPVTTPDLFRTVETLVGLDPDEVRNAPSGRPINMVDGGTVVTELLPRAETR